MVVVIEDITDQHEEEEEKKRKIAEEDRATAAGDDEEDRAVEEEEVDQNSETDWVKVDPADEQQGVQKTDLEEKQDAARAPGADAGAVDQQEIDPEEFAAQLAKADALKMEGNKLFANGDYEEAIERYSDALEEAPFTAPLQRSVYFANRAACHLKLESFSEAIIDCSAALELHPNYIKALMRRAASLEAIKNYDEALMDLRRVLEIEPENTIARASVARVEPLALQKQEEMKEEMMGKLKELGNTVLGKFGLSLDNFKTEKDPDTGSYSIKFQQE